MSTIWETAEVLRQLEADKLANRKARTPCRHSCGNPDTRMFGCFCELPTKLPACELCNDLGWRLITCRYSEAGRPGGLRTFVVRCEAKCPEVPGALKDAQYLARLANGAKVHTQPAAGRPELIGNLIER